MSRSNWITRRMPDGKSIIRTADRRKSTARSITLPPSLLLHYYRLALRHPGCAEPPVFKLEVVSPEKPTSEGSAWEETYAISCKERVRRTFLLFLSVKEGMKHSELAPGDTLADAILQRDFLQSATAAAMSRARAGCRGTPFATPA